MSEFLVQSSYVPVLYFLICISFRMIKRAYSSAAIARHRLCMDALRYALEFYRILSQGAAVIHDGAAMMFSSEDLAAALKEVRITDL